MANHHHYLVLVIAVLATIMISSSEAQDHEVYEGKTSFIFKKHGGFIGDIDFPIFEEIDGWNMTITCPKNIFKFEVSMTMTNIREDIPACMIA